MNRYQTGVLAYLHERGSQFIDWTASLPGENILMPLDMCPLALRFLDHQFRQEMALYERDSKRYDSLIDLLIEVNLTVPEDFRARLSGTCVSFLTPNPDLPH